MNSRRKLSGFAGTSRAPLAQLCQGHDRRVSSGLGTAWMRMACALAMLAVSGVVACGGSVKVDPGGGAGAGPAAAGASPGAAGGAPGSAGSPSPSAGSGNSGNASSSGASGGLGVGGEAGASGTCVVDGVVHAIGEPFACECNTCWCDAYGGISGTLIACNDCVYAGRNHALGEVFPARDGCNQCSCQNFGDVSCTEKACGCQPDKEWYRKYESTNVKACGLLDFECPAGTTYFANDCGCGCEQASSCPEWIDCAPGNSGCESSKMLCPFSGIAL